MFILLKWVIVGIVASVVGLALRSLWMYLKRQRVYLLNKYWRPVNVGLLVFVIWILWELFLLTAIATDDGKTWLDALGECDDRFIWGDCISNAHQNFFSLFLLSRLLLKAAVAGILAAILLKIDSVVIKILTDAHGDTGKKNDSGKPSRIGKWFARFRRRKSGDQSAPSAKKKPPTHDRPEQTDPVVNKVVATGKDKPVEKKDNGKPSRIGKWFARFGRRKSGDQSALSAKKKPLANPGAESHELK